MKNTNTLDVVRVDCDDAPNDLIDKVNKVLIAYGLQLVDDDKEHDGFILYSLVDSAVEVDNEVGTFMERIEIHALGYSKSVGDNWDKTPDVQRKPETLTLAAFLDGAAMARVVIEQRGNLAALLAEKSTRFREE
jgi:hypothetical protein